MVSEHPSRYNCLCCDQQYLRKPELKPHVRDSHSAQDIATALLPLNIPGIARFADDPEITTEYEAQVAIRRDGRDGTLPDATAALTEGRCPVCGDRVAPDASAPARAVPPHGHDVWLWYLELRQAIPDAYEQSPVLDQAGVEGPAGTVMELVPDDRIHVTVDGWSQSVSTGRFQRGSVSGTDTWEIEGVVTRIDDSRTEPLPRPSFFDDDVDKEVTVAAQADFAEDTTLVTLHPKDDGSVRVQYYPEYDGPTTAQQWGRGGPGYIKGSATTVTRTPWHEAYPNASKPEPR